MGGVHQGRGGKGVHPGERDAARALAALSALCSLCACVCMHTSLKAVRSLFFLLSSGIIVLLNSMRFKWLKAVARLSVVPKAGGSCSASRSESSVCLMSSNRWTSNVTVSSRISL